MVVEELVMGINPDHGLLGIHSSKPNTAGGAAISFLPAGTPMKPDSNENKGDPSDTSKDRIWVGQQPVGIPTRSSALWTKGWDYEIDEDFTTGGCVCSISSGLYADAMNAKANRKWQPLRR